MAKTIRIGSRDSQLATWQAEEVQQKLHKKGISSEIRFIKSKGDLIQNQPLHTIGTVGLFTKALDDALLNNEIDIAVHSCKDLPSSLHEKLGFFAFLEREIPFDVIVGKRAIDFFDDPDFSGTIATGSVRRKAQILAQFPHANVVGLRGNVPTRLQKLKESNWDGAVFAYAGLKRLGIEPEFFKQADFMVPAPAQGVVVAVGRKEDQELLQKVGMINHRETEVTTKIERNFLRLMEGGCISPIGAYAKMKGEEVVFQISVLSPDGTEQIHLTEVHPVSDGNSIAEIAFENAVKAGAKDIIDRIETKFHKQN